MLYGYARVSTDKQEDSADDQARRLREYAERTGAAFGGVFVDEDQSASKIKFSHRTQGRVLWDKLQPGDSVVFTKSDRAFRSVLDAVTTVAHWKSLGIGAIFLDTGIDITTPAGELFFNQMSAFAQFESQMIGQRQRDSIAYRKRAGRPYGTMRPFGWVAKDKAFVPYQPERDIGDLVVAMRQAGTPFTAICLHLCKKELRKPANKRGVRGYYGLTDTVALHRAAVAGYPKLPPRLSQSQWRDETQRAEKSHATQPAHGASCHGRTCP
jgi:DNA invertase Pin-like site-specific DNA recombinase